MANRKLVMRVGALGLMGGAMALFAAQAGVLSGFELGSNSAESPDSGATIAAVQIAPDAQPPAALAAVLGTPAPEDDRIPDAFARTQTHDLDERSGFSAAPVIVAAAPALPIDRDLLRPAAFNPAAGLPLPGSPAPEPEPKTTEALSPLGLPCGLDVTAGASEAAMIALDIAAPCHPDTAVTITHSGMTIAVQTDAVGLMTLDLPALEAPAFVTVTLPDGSASDVLVDVPDLADYDRVALAWQGDLGVELHVLENSAAWMAEGHVRPDAPRSVTAAEAGGGFLTLLGDGDLAAPMLAQVYTTPLGNGPVSIELSIDAPVTVANCTQTAEARLLHVVDGAGADVMPLGFTYPTCDAVGDTLVLQNVFDDLRLAAN
jgi:hypothetical protein